jgi:peptidoglycan/LPS O-acetylase OafA/YrhL
MKRFAVLDSFRGCCAIAVMIYHSHAMFTFTETRFFRSADYFVEFFFILSGFVLTHTYTQRLKSTGQLRDFMVSRFFRLYPLHALMLVVFIGLEALKMVAERHGVFFANASFTGARAPSEIIPNLLLIQSWWPGFNAMSFNFPAWSISVEFYLYLLFGVTTLWLPGRTRWVALSILVLSLLALVTHNTEVTVYSLKGLSGFFAGQVAYLIYQRLQAMKMSYWLATLLEVSALIAIYGVMTYLGGSRDLVLLPLFCVTVFIYAFEAGALSVWLRHAVFERLGTLSFSIYMIHASVLFVIPVVLSVYAQRYGVNLLTDQVEVASGTLFRYIDTGSVGLNTLLVVIPMFITLGLAELSYRFVELPGIAMGKRLGRSRRQAAVPADPLVSESPLGK